eukprot:scaffold401925_cov24-Prasinocladus_malaysianus.AAC.1
MTTFTELKQGFISCCPALSTYHYELAQRQLTSRLVARGGDRGSPKQLSTARCWLGRRSAVYSDGCNTGATAVLISQ